MEHGMSLLLLFCFTSFTPRTTKKYIFLRDSLHKKHDDVNGTGILRAQAVLCALI